MMKKLFFLFSLFLIINFSYSQQNITPQHGPASNINVSRIDISEKNTILKLMFLKKYENFTFQQSTSLIYRYGNKMGVLKLNKVKFKKSYILPDYLTKIKYGAKYSLIFPPLPKGINNVRFILNSECGFPNICWDFEIKFKKNDNQLTPKNSELKDSFEIINKSLANQVVVNPSASASFRNRIQPNSAITKYKQKGLNFSNEQSVQNYFDENYSGGIDGIWEYLNFDGNNHKLAILKVNDYLYKAHVINSNVSGWKDGDVKATFETTAINTIFTIWWIMANYSMTLRAEATLNNDALIEFTLPNSEKTLLHKIYPSLNSKVTKGKK